MRLLIVVMAGGLAAGAYFARAMTDVTGGLRQFRTPGAMAGRAGASIIPQAAGAWIGRGSPARRGVAKTGLSTPDAASMLRGPQRSAAASLDASVSR